MNAILENTQDSVNDEIKDKETKMTLWLLSWASEKKSDTTTENKKAEKVPSLKNKEKFDVKHKYLRQDLTDDPNGMELEFK